MAIKSGHCRLMVWWINKKRRPGCNPDYTDPPDSKARRSDRHAARTAVYGGKPFDGTVYTFEYQFTPTISQVPAGTTITFQNDGAVIHTATSADGSWDTGDIPASTAAQVTFNTAGTFTYNCTPHPWMIGRIIVQ